MTILYLRLLAVALAGMAGCAHSPPTGMEHRQAAAAQLAAADRERAKFDPAQTTIAVTPRVTGFTDEAAASPRFYNPSAAHLAEADRKMASAFEHLEAARRLEKYEDVACAGISDAERVSCPLIAPHLEKIEEGSRGVVLHLKSSERAKTLSTQMRCHLAFAQANNFDRAPCPLYLKGVTINLISDRAIEVVSPDPKIARELHREARTMFGQPPST